MTVMTLDKDEDNAESESEDDIEDDLWQEEVFDEVEFAEISKNHEKMKKIVIKRYKIQIQI